MLEISKIKIDGTQSRTEINENTLTEYAEAITSGADFPAVVVFYDGKDYWLADGFHRLLAHSRAGKTKIFEEIKLGSKRDAILYSVGANHSHGLRRSNADKRNAAMMLLLDDEWSKLSDNAISKYCHVTQQFISKLRGELGERPSEKTVTRGNTTYTQNTSSIGNKESGRSVADVFKSIESPPVKDELHPSLTASTAQSEPEPLYSSREEELEQQVRELGDCLEDTMRALKDLQNENAEGYVSEITKLRRDLEAVTISRDAYMFKCGELQKDLNSKERLIKKLQSK